MIRLGWKDYGFWDGKAIRRKITAAWFWSVGYHFFSIVIASGHLRLLPRTKLYFKISISKRLMFDIFDVSVSLDPHRPTKTRY
jgi:hypothetical protein